MSGPLRTSAYNGQGYATGHHHHHHTGQQHHTHTSNTLAHQTSRFLTRLRGDSSTSGAAGEGVGRDSEPRGQLELLLNKLLTAASMGRIPAANLMATFQQLWSAVQVRRQGGGVTVGEEVACAAARRHPTPAWQPLPSAFLLSWGSGAVAHTHRAQLLCSM